MPIIPFLIVVVPAWYFGLFEAVHIVLAIIIVLVLTFITAIFVNPILSLGLYLGFFAILNFFLGKDENEQSNKDDDKKG